MFAICAGSSHSSILVGNSPIARNKSPDFVFRADEFVVGAGEIVSFVKEVDLDPAKIDHFWITIRAGRFGLRRISISTWSLRHAADGFDPRMRVGVCRPPGRNCRRAASFRLLASITTQLERTSPIVYREMERPAVEERLAAKVGGPSWLEFLFEQTPLHAARSLRRGGVIVKQDLRRLNLSIQGSQPGHRYGLQERAEAVYQDPTQPTANYKGFFAG